MSVLDKFLNAMKLNPDEEDDFYDDDFYDDDDEKPETPRKTKHKEKVKEEPEDEVEGIKDRGKRSSKVTPIRPGKQQINGWEVCIVEATSLDAGKKVTDILLSNRPVVLNISGVDEEESQRIVDFSSGACCALQGHSQKIARNIFLFTPPNIDISGQSTADLDHLDPDPGIRMDF